MGNQDTLEQVAEVARLEHYKQREQAFVASFLDTVTNGGGTINMLIRNPADSGFVIDIVEPVLATQFKGEISIYDQFADGGAPSGGTDLPVDNLLMDSDGSNGSSEGGVTVKRGVSFTAGNSPHFTKVIPSGGVGGTGVGGLTHGTEALIEPGREVVLELTNGSSGDAKGSIGLTYIERSDLL